jgi:hypothetical protein
MEAGVSAAPMFYFKISQKGCNSKKIRSTETEQE